MSDGPGKLTSSPGSDIEPEPLDDIILGEDDEEVAAAKPQKPAPPPMKQPSRSPPPPVASKSGSVPPKGADVGAGAEVSSSKPGKKPSSGKMKASADALALTDTKKRPKMTLRIPDDEISRPQLPATTPAGGVHVAGGSIGTSASGSRPPPPMRDDRFDDAPPIQPQRIISTYAAAPVTGADDTLELPGDEVRARMAAITNEAGAEGEGRALGIDTSTEKGWTPYQPSVGDGNHHANTGRNGGATIVDARERIASAPVSEEIPIVTDDVPDPSGEDLATRPRLPDGPDSEEIKIDDGDRVTDPADAPEIDPDDLVSVESMPRPGNVAGKYPAFKAPTGAAAALAAATPQAPPVAPTPSAPAVSPAAAPPPVASAPVAAPSNPSPGGGAAPTPRISSPELPALATPGSAFRPAQNLVVPAVGALAPPPMNETAAHRKKGRPWWEDLFNDDFIRTMAKISESQIKGEVDFIEESLGCEAGAMVLDLACGTGRHAVELATRGYQVVGFDLSLAMLARASDEAQDRKQKINFVQGDMRDMTFEETFDGVYAWNTSFGYFDEEKNAAVIAKVHKSLKKGGQFLLDVINRDYVIRTAPSLAWFEGDGCICMDEMGIDFITSRMKVKRTLMMDDGRTKEIEYSIRVYALHELGKMLHDNGFRVAEVSGRTGTPGVFFGCESPRTLILAEKR